MQLRTSERIITAVVRSLGGDSETALKPAGATFLCPQTTVLNWRRLRRVQEAGLRPRAVALGHGGDLLMLLFETYGGWTGASRWWRAALPTDPGKGAEQANETAVPTRTK